MSNKSSKVVLKKFLGEGGALLSRTVARVRRFARSSRRSRPRRSTGPTACVRTRRPPPAPRRPVSA
jgi:hypothetical protein